jgi:hypothetical protein
MRVKYSISTNFHAERNSISTMRVCVKAFSIRYEVH